MFKARKIVGSRGDPRSCDKCHQLPTAANPLYELEVHSPGNFHLVRIHVQCFADAVASTETREAA